jgi:hypothetical protein
MSDVIPFLTQAGLEEARKSFGTDEDILLISRATPDATKVESVLQLVSQ